MNAISDSSNLEESTENNNTPSVCNVFNPMFQCAWYDVPLRKIASVAILQHLFKKAKG